MWWSASGSRAGRKRPHGSHSRSGPLTRRAWRGAKSSDHRHALDFEHHLRLGEAGDGDGGAGRKILAEDLMAQFGHARGVARIDQEYRHGDEVGEAGAGLGERLLDIAEA